MTLEPFPLPRGVVEDHRRLPLVRGLGTMLNGGTVLDLSIDGEVAREEAGHLLVAAMETTFADAGLRVAWTARESSRLAASFDGVDVTAVKASVGRACDLVLHERRVQPRGVPSFASENVIRRGEVVLSARFELTSEGGVAEFRGAEAPGYRALVESATQPYRAEGWLWVPGGAVRDGYRLADETAGRALHESPLYDIGLDLVIAVVESWHRQRDDWARGSVRLRDGRVIDVGPRRLVRLDLREIASRLDPLGQRGQNWRSKLVSALVALSGLEHRVVGRRGRVLDAGDRLLHRVVDARLNPDELADVVAREPSGLVASLARQRAVPGDDVFVEVSPDFVERHWVVVRDVDGTPRWGTDAAIAAANVALAAAPEDRRAAKAAATRRREDAKRRPYFAFSPRLAAAAQAMNWSMRRRQLVLQILMERTRAVRRAGRLERTRDDAGAYALESKEGVSVVRCGGSKGRGYRAQTWMQRVGYAGVSAREVSSFSDDVEAAMHALHVDVEVTGLAASQSGGAALEVLRSLAPEVLQRAMLVFFIPADLEERLDCLLRGHGVQDRGDASPDGRELRLARVSAGLTQAQLAQRLGVVKSFVCQVETGVRRIPPDRRTAWTAALGPVPAA